MWIIEKNRKKLTLKDYGLFAVLGLTGIVFYNICFFIATKQAPVIKSSFFIAEYRLPLQLEQYIKKGIMFCSL